VKREGELRDAGKLGELSCRPLGGVGAGEGRENLRRRGPSNAFLEGEWYSNTPLKQGVSGTMVFTHLQLLLGRDRMADQPPDDYGGGDRPLGAPQHHPGAEPSQLSAGAGEEAEEGMKKGQRAQTGDESEKPCAPEARQCIFWRRVVLGHPPFQGLVGRAVDEDEPDAEDGYTWEEVSNREEHQGWNVFQGCGPNVFPPSLPPPGRAERDGNSNCRQAGSIVDAGQGGAEDKERERNQQDERMQKARGHESDPEKRHTNSVEGYPQAAAARILNNPSAAFVDNPRRGVGDLRHFGCTAPRKVQLVREKGGFVEEKRSETSLTNRD